MRRFCERLDADLGRFLDLTSWAALPLALLLVAQWPLRDLVRAYSRDANDMAQWIFALYIGLAITAATRAHAHLAVDLLAQRYSAGARRLIRRAGNFLAVAPWSVFVLVAGTPSVIQSIRQLEGFPDTYNPGYFLVKLAAWLLAAALLLQAILEELRDTGKRS